MTSADAIDALFTLIKAAWEANSSGPIKWPDSIGALPTSGEWARVSVQHSDGGQDSLSDQIGTVKYADIGVVYVQIFTPIGDAALRNYTLANAILLAFRKAKISGMIFRRSRIREVGPDGAFLHTQALTGFEYESHA